MGVDENVRMVVSNGPLSVQLIPRDDHGKRTGIRGGMATVCVYLLFSLRS